MWRSVAVKRFSANACEKNRHRSTTKTKPSVNHWMDFARQCRLRKEEQTDLGKQTTSEETQRGDP